MSAWVGIGIGGALGGVLGYALGKKDLGVAVAAGAAGALIGGALTASKPQDQTNEATNTQPQAPTTTP